MATTSSPSTSLPWHPLHHAKLNPHPNIHLSFLSPPRRPHPPRRLAIVSFQRGDFDAFRKRVVSGEAWKEVWRNANDGFEQLVYEARKSAERFDRQYAVSRQFSSAADAVYVRAREIDREFEVSQKWQAFSVDFSRNLPRYRKQFSELLDTPLGRSSATIFFLWFALSGWLFRCLIFATWVLPIAGPLLLSTVANNLVVKGACPSCKREFIGSKRSMIQCNGCGNIVWQPQDQVDFFSRGKKSPTRSKKSEPEIIDVDFEER